MIEYKYTNKSKVKFLANSVVYKSYTDGDIHEVMMDFRRFLLAVGYCEETINKYIEAE